MKIGLDFKEKRIVTPKTGIPTANRALYSIEISIRSLGQLNAHPRAMQSPIPMGRKVISQKKD